MKKPISFKKYLQGQPVKISADEFGIPESTIKSWRTGERNPTKAVIPGLIKDARGQLCYESFFI